MRSKIFISLFTFIFFSNTLAEDLIIQAKNITLDKDNLSNIYGDNLTRYLHHHQKERFLNKTIGNS